jgi:hypothetical protein
MEDKHMQYFEYLLHILTGQGFFPSLYCVQTITGTLPGLLSGGYQY